MNNPTTSPDVNPCLSRRQFLLATGGASVLLAGVPGMIGSVEAQVVDYPKKKVAQLSELKVDEPIDLMYPYDDLTSLSFLVKLGTPAGGGVGPDNDIVSFSTMCTHMGGDLSDTRKTYMKDHKILGPCPLHLTTFDLTRHGMVVAGHATQSLPQLVLKVEGDDIYATGILGLIYGNRDSLDNPEL